jgi:hypothetical protein
VGGNVVAAGEIGQQIEKPGHLRRQAEERLAHPADRQKDAGCPHQQQRPAFLGPMRQEGRRAAMIMVHRFCRHTRRRNRLITRRTQHLVDDSARQLRCVIGDKRQPDRIVDVGVQHAGKCGQLASQRIGRVGGVDAGDGNLFVPVLRRDFRAGCLGQSLNLREGQKAWVEVNAQLGVAVAAVNMNVVDASVRLQSFHQKVHTIVALIDFRQHQVKFKLEFLHRKLP